jgi:ABC-type nitrate/sulfonate/bicarbonate transport system substrate-binding protein
MSDQMLTSYLKSQGKYDANDANANEIVSILADKYYEPAYEAAKEQYEKYNKNDLKTAFESTDQASGLSFKE